MRQAADEQVRETQRLVKTSQEQLEAQIMPAIAVHSKGSPHGLELVNVGKGPVLGVILSAAERGSTGTRGRLSHEPGIRGHGLRICSLYYWPGGARTLRCTRGRRWRSKRHGRSFLIPTTLSVLRQHFILRHCNTEVSASIRYFLGQILITATWATVSTWQCLSESGSLISIFGRKGHSRKEVAI
jgi:hypothetical protein